jgi:hypothetical protein
MVHDEGSNGLSRASRFTPLHTGNSSATGYEVSSDVHRSHYVRASPPVCRNHNHNHKRRGTYEHMIGPKNHTFQTNRKLYGSGELSKTSPTGKP